MSSSSILANVSDGKRIDCVCLRLNADNMLVVKHCDGDALRRLEPWVALGKCSGWDAALSQTVMKLTLAATLKAILESGVEGTQENDVLVSVNKEVDGKGFFLKHPRRMDKLALEVEMHCMVSKALSENGLKITRAVEMTVLKETVCEGGVEDVAGDDTILIEECSSVPSAVVDDFDDGVVLQDGFQ